MTTEIAAPMDTFATPAPAKGAPAESDVAGIETFDSEDVKIPEKKNLDKKYAEPDKKSEVDLLEDNPLEDGGKKGAKKDEKRATGDDGKKDSKEEKGTKEGEEAKPVGDEKKDLDKSETKEIPGGSKPIKARMGDKEVELSPETEFRQKVDGKFETFKLRDLLNRKAGEVSIEKRLNEISLEKKTFTKEVEKYKSEKQEVVGIISKVAELLDNKEANPLDVVQFLVDITGRDPIAYNEKMKDYLLKELDTLDSMTEEERQLYWKDKEIQFLRHRHQSSVTRSKQQRDQQSVTASIDKMREAKGVSQEQFVSAYNDLLSEGVKEEQLTAEIVVERAVMRPFFDKAEKLVTPLEEDLASDEFDALVTETARLLKEFPHFSDLEALKHAAKRLNFEVEEVDSSTSSIEKKLNSLPTPSRPTTNKKAYKGKVSKIDDDTEIETFED